MEENNDLDFHQDIEKGIPGEEMYIQYLINNNIHYVDVRSEKDYRKMDVDFLVGEKERMVDVKTNYKDNDQLIFETYGNCEPKYGKKTDGWAYTSWAEYFVFISLDTGKMIEVVNDTQFYFWFKFIAMTKHLNRNKDSYNKKTGSKWQSAYIKLDLEEIPKKFIKYLT